MSPSRSEKICLLFYILARGFCSWECLTRDFGSRSFTWSWKNGPITNRLRYAGGQPCWGFFIGLFSPKYWYGAISRVGGQTVGRLFGYFRPCISPQFPSHHGDAHQKQFNFLPRPYYEASSEKNLCGPWSKAERLGMPQAWNQTSLCWPKPAVGGGAEADVGTVWVRSDVCYEHYPHRHRKLRGSWTDRTTWPV